MAENNIYKRETITKDEVSELLDLYDKDSINQEAVQNIDKRKILQLMQNIMSGCVEGNFDKLKDYDEYMYILNEVTDEYIDGLDEAYKQAYNFFALNFIADTLHIYLKVNHSKNNFNEIISDMTSYKIIKELNIAGVLTQSELADRLGLETTTLSNQLKKLQDSNVFIKYKIPENKRQTFYTLSADCKKFFNSENVLPGVTKRPSVNRNTDARVSYENSRIRNRKINDKSYLGGSFTSFPYYRDERISQEYNSEAVSASIVNILKKIKGEKYADIQ